MSRTADKTDEQEQKLFVGGLNKKDTDEEKIKGYVMLWSCSISFFAFMTIALV